MIINRFDVSIKKMDSCLERLSTRALHDGVGGIDQKIRGCYTVLCVLKAILLNQVIQTTLHDFRFWQVAVHRFQSDRSVTSQAGCGTLEILSNFPLKHGPGSAHLTALWLQE
jgi:hypothetical protein